RRRPDRVPDPPAPAGRRAAGALRRGRTLLEVTARAPPAERVVVRIRVGVDHHHVDPVAPRPQVDHARFHAREAVIVFADLARFVAVDAADEGHFPVLLEHRRVVEAGATGEETPAHFVAGPARAAVGIQAGGGGLRAGASLPAVPARS